MVSSRPSHNYTQSERIADALHRRIADGELKRGERLSSEYELAQEFGASRGTIRRALAILQQSELVHTKPGSGSYVAFHGADLSGPQGWTAATEQVGMPTSTRVVSVELIETPEHLVAICPEAQCYQAVRVRHFEGTPLSLETSTFPATQQVRTLMEYGLLGGSVSKTLEVTGLVTSRGHQDISARRLSTRHAELLEKPPGTRVIVSQRTGLDAGGGLSEYVESWLDPDHFTFHLEFSGESA